MTDLKLVIVLSCEQRCGKEGRVRGEERDREKQGERGRAGKEECKD